MTPHTQFIAIGLPGDLAIRKAELLEFEQLRSGKVAQLPTAQQLLLSVDDASQLLLSVVERETAPVAEAVKARVGEQLRGVNQSVSQLMEGVQVASQMVRTLRATMAGLITTNSDHARAAATSGKRPKCITVITLLAGDDMGSLRRTGFNKILPRQFQRCLNGF